MSKCWFLGQFSQNIGFSVLKVEKMCQNIDRKVKMCLFFWFLGQFSQNSTPNLGFLWQFSQNIDFSVSKGRKMVSKL